MEAKYNSSCQELLCIVIAVSIRSVRVGLLEMSETKWERLNGHKELQNEAVIALHQSAKITPGTQPAVCGAEGACSVSPRLRVRSWEHAAVPGPEEPGAR